MGIALAYTLTYPSRRTDRGVASSFIRYEIEGVVLESKFHHMGTSIIGRIDEMGSRIDELEQTIGTIMDHAGIEPPTGVTTTSMGATSNHNTSIATPTSTMRSDASI
eukprot:scaffold45035_cov49-Attheya_sp.AAC.2